IGGQHDPGPQPRAVDDVIAAEAVDDDMVAGLEAGDCDVFSQPGHRNHAVVLGDVDDVVAVGRIDDDGVGRAVTDAAAWRRFQIDRHVLDVGRGEVVDGDGIRTAPGGEVDGLDIVEVHRDAGDVAGEYRAAVVG